jgi:hypothetical protein
VALVEVIDGHHWAMKQMRKDFLVTVEWDEEGSSSPTPSDMRQSLKTPYAGW